MGKSLLAEKMSFVEQDKTLYLNNLIAQGSESPLLMPFFFSFLCDTTALQTCGSTSSASQSEAPPAWWMGVIQLAEKISSKSE